MICGLLYGMWAFVWYVGSFICGHFYYIFAFFIFGHLYGVCVFVCYVG